MQQAFPRLAQVVNGWQMNIDTMGVYGNFYVKRAIITMIGLGANSAEDAIYPILLVDADGKPLAGDNDYVLHFGKTELPPVHAFWSLTMYDAEGFQAANSLNRFAIGDRDPLQYNTDGSVDLYLQHKSPGHQQGGQLAARAAGPAWRHNAALLPDSPRVQRHLGTTGNTANLARALRPGSNARTQSRSARTPIQLAATRSAITPAQQPLHAIRADLTRAIGQRPPVLPLQARDQPRYVLPHPGTRLSSGEPACDPLHAPRPARPLRHPPPPTR